MRALVLGGNGFIGSHLVDQLLISGVGVRVFNRGPERIQRPLSSIEYITGEFNDIDSLGDALTDIDVVYHLISTTVPSTSNNDPVRDITDNLVNTVNLLELMRQKSVSRIVYLSSGGTVYGIPEVSPIRETHPLQPISSYGVVKVAIENYLHMFYELHGISYVALRASNPYGPRQSNAGLQGVIGTYINCLKNGRSLEVWGNGEIIRDFIHVEDLVSLCVSAGMTDAVGCFNAGFGEGASILDIIDILSEHTGMSIVPIFREGRSFDVPHVVLDIEKTTEEFNWRPKISLKAGIARTLVSNVGVDNLEKRVLAAYL